AAGSHELIHVHVESVGDHARLEIDACLLQIERVGAGGVRDLRIAGLGAQVAAERQKSIDVARPDIGARVHVGGGELGLRKHVAEGCAHAAACRIDVTLPALESRLHRQIGLRVGGAHAAEAQRRQQPVPGGSQEISDHCAGLTVNTNEKSAPSDCAAMSASAPPPVPRTVTRYCPGPRAVAGWITMDEGFAAASEALTVTGVDCPSASASSV